MLRVPYPILRNNRGTWPWSESGEVKLKSANPHDEPEVNFNLLSDHRDVVRLLEGDFPAYRALIPADFASSASVNTTTLIDAVKRVALVAARNTPIRMSFVAGEVVLDAGSGVESQASEAIEAQYEGEPMTIAFNPTYLLDGLVAIGTDEAELSFNGPVKPAVITGKGAEDYRYLLMPIRLSG